MDEVMFTKSRTLNQRPSRSLSEFEYETILQILLGIMQ